MVFFFAVLGRLLSRSAWGRAFVCTVDDLSRRLIQQAVFKGVLGVALLPNGQYGLLVALFRFRSIRALGRPISLSLNTGSWSPYFAFAQYGLWLRLCARAVALARIRLRWPRLCARAVALARIRLRQLVYCPMGNTPSQCRLGTPRRAAIELKSLNYRHFI